MPYQTPIWPLYGSPPFQKLDFGLCARVFSAVFLSLEPTIDFSYCSAVSPSKSRDFRLPEPAIYFFPLVSGFEPTIPLATHGQRLHFRLATARTNQKPGNRTSGVGLVPYQNHIKPIYGPYMGHPPSKNWTLAFAPAFLQRFYSPLSPRSIFHTAQRFLLPNHVTSGCLSPRSIFSHWSAVLSPPSP